MDPPRNTYSPFSNIRSRVTIWFSTVISIESFGNVFHHSRHVFTMAGRVSVGTTPTSSMKGQRRLLVSENGKDPPAFLPSTTRTDCEPNFFNGRPVKAQQPSQWRNSSPLSVLTVLMVDSLSDYSLASPTSASLSLCLFKFAVTVSLSRRFSSCFIYPLSSAKHDCDASRWEPE